jgi:cytidine deaminase
MTTTPITTDDLIAAARAVMPNAWAPYSRFKVGAAILTPAGNIHPGVNVENAAYPQGTCAEAGAIAAMVAAGETRIAAIAVIADAPGPVAPCGGCRQKIAEFAGPDVPVTMANLSGATLTMTVAELLPGAFLPSDLPE